MNAAAILKQKLERRVRMDFDTIINLVLLGAIGLMAINSQADCTKLKKEMKRLKDEVEKLKEKS